MTNEEYVRQRNALIPEALEHANSAAGPEPDEKKEREAWTAKWNTAFHDEMNRLATCLIK